VGCSLNRMDIINLSVDKYGYKSYLEIGVFTGDTIRGVRCPNKVGVDGGDHYRASEVTHFMTSDEFFDNNKEMFDCIFIDACHDAPFVCRDLNNALRFLNEGGSIFMHDCFPPDRRHSMPDKCGDAFKVVRSVVENYSEYLSCRVFDADYGVGMVRKIKEPHPIVYDEGYTYEMLIKNPSVEINLTQLFEIYRYV
jgi:hypothetical protein